MEEIKKSFEKATPLEFIGYLIIAAILLRVLYEIITDK
jgi:hypothetical protein